jgi:hypothetical protein
MKIAIIYTGEIRTLYKVFPYFKQNCILSDDYHVYGIIQDNGDCNCYQFLKNNLEDNLKSYESFNNMDSTFYHLRERLINNMDLNDNTIKYLRNSGSIIEYYQMFLAYQNIGKYEANNNFTYDYIIRIRCDCVITKPINFDWIKYTKDDIFESLNNIKNLYEKDTIIDKEIVSIFMNSLINKNKYFIKDNIERTKLCLSNSFVSLFNTEYTETFIDNFYKYFKKGKYMISLRKNILYLLKRKYFTRIFNLGISYGMVNRYLSNEYWWNAESQLQIKCLENNIDIYDNFTFLEDCSLYLYNKNNYFDENNNLIINNNVLFFLMRN